MRQFAVRISTPPAPCGSHSAPLPRSARRFDLFGALARLPLFLMRAAALTPALVPTLMLTLSASLVPATAYAQGIAPFSISSPDFEEGGLANNHQMYNQGRCHGANRSPAITWHHAPAGTLRFAVTLYDADAPGRGWWLWAVANIPASVRSLPENAAHSGALAALGAVQARNDLDDDGYSGPCAPAGTVHRYVLTVYALKSADLRVEDARPAAFFDHEISANTLAKASITVTNRPLP